MERPTAKSPSRIAAILAIAALGPAVAPAIEPPAARPPAAAELPPNQRGTPTISKIVLIKRKGIIARRSACSPDVSPTTGTSA